MNNVFEGTSYNLWPTLKFAHEIISQSVVPEYSYIYGEFFEKQRETNAKLLSKMNLTYTQNIKGFPVVDHVGPKARIGANLGEFTSDAPLTNIVQELINMGRFSVLDYQAIDVLMEFNRPIVKDILPGVQHLLPTGMMTHELQTTAESMLSKLWKSTNISEVARAPYCLFNYDGLSPLMAQISSVIRADAIAKDISETIASQLEISETIIQKLGRTLDFYQLADLPMAMKVAIADPEIAEAIEELIDDHPQEIQALTSAISWADFRALFPGPPSSYVKTAVPWFSAFGAYSGAAFSGVTGPTLAYIVIASILVALCHTWEDILKEEEYPRS